VHIVLSKLQEHQLFIKKSTCAFGSRSVAYLDHFISTQGVAMDEQKIHAVLDWPPPRTVRVMHAFLGLVEYYHRFIKDFNAIVKPLTMLLRKDGFKWSLEATQAFVVLQRAPTRAMVLQLPMFDAVFIVKYDASGSGIDAILHSLLPEVSARSTLVHHPATPLGEQAPGI
jgi:hypothetical protein